MAGSSLAVLAFLIALLSTAATVIGLVTPYWIGTILSKVDITLGIFQICEAGYGNSACSSIIEYALGGFNNNPYAILLPSPVFTAIRVVFGTLVASIILSIIALILLGIHICGAKEGGQRGPIVGGTFLLSSAILSIAGIVTFIGILLNEKQMLSSEKQGSQGALAGLQHLVISMGYSFWLACGGGVFTVIASSLSFFSS